MKTAIVLAGGLGTRLQSVVADVPKPMAPIRQKPFLSYLLHYLQKQGIETVILSVGHKYEIIQAFVGDNYLGMNILYAIEATPLGTGGGIRLAMEMTEDTDVFILNGDTFFDVNLKELGEFHQKCNADLTISVKKMENFDRYGTIGFEGKRVTQFLEKMACTQGYINGGVYALKGSFLHQQYLPQKCSFEKDIMEALYAQSQFYVFTDAANHYFIDIGIPEDFERAQVEL